MKSPAYNTKHGKTHVRCEYRVEKISKLSKNAIELLKSIEELKLLPYDDQTGKTINSYVPGATIGYGHLIKEKEWEKYKGGISEEEANILFNDDLLTYETSVYNLITAQLSQNEFDALVIFVFNIGESQFKQSSVLKMVNGKKGNYNTLEDAWMAFKFSQGKVLQGLINRRRAEYNIFTNGIYMRW